MDPKTGDEAVVTFLRNCGEPNLQFLLIPKRLKKSLEALDTDKSGELDIDEWEEAIHRGLAKRVEQLQEEQARRARAAAAADEAFSAECGSGRQPNFASPPRDASLCRRRRPNGASPL